MNTFELGHTGGRQGLVPRQQQTHRRGEHWMGERRQTKDQEGRRKRMERTNGIWVDLSGRRGFER
jgi:hypothetical protein